MTPDRFAAGDIVPRGEAGPVRDRPPFNLQPLGEVLAINVPAFWAHDWIAEIEANENLQKLCCTT